ncbi:unnamed protein product [Cuscuta europaea]|uniref:Uncharacterized protein n=1 Tax=Cuscuta europaea TaxID=41803 RepID=A0A9P0ZNB9_CUSEU|nr:unnamed protein product [Cuscuta europaea]
MFFWTPATFQSPLQCRVLCSIWTPTTSIAATIWTLTHIWFRRKHWNCFPSSLGESISRKPYIISIDFPMADRAPYKAVLKNVNTQQDDKAVLLLRVVRRWNVRNKGNSLEPYMIEMVLIEEVIF